jgi:hypothetical protein
MVNPDLATMTVIGEHSRNAPWMFLAVQTAWRAMTR